jgi:hypothetical protein
MKRHIFNCKTKQSEIRDLTSEEETKYNQDIVKAKEIKEAEASANATKKTKKASGKQKLKDLGLDDEEIKALIGA